MEINQEKTKILRYLNEIIKSSFPPFIIFAPDGKILYGSDSFCEMTGYSLEELTGLSIVDKLTAPKWRWQVLAMQNKISAGKTPQSYFMELQHGSGHLIPVDVWSSAVKHQDGSIKYLFSFFLISHTPEQEQVSAQKAAVRKEEAPDKSVEDLIGDLSNKDTYIRMKSIESLGKLKARSAVIPLIKLLKDGSKDIRRNVAFSLGDIGDKAAVEPLLRALSDMSSDVRWSAAIALGNIGDARAVEDLTAAADDHDVDVRRAAKEALAKIKKAIK